MRARRRSKRKCGCSAARTVLRPGSAAYARLVLREPALLLPGDRFIIRMFSPVVTIGGGVVVDTGGKRYRKGDERGSPAATSAPAPRAAASRPAGARIQIRHGDGGTGGAHRHARSGRSTAARDAPLVAVPQPQPWYVDRAWFQAARERWSRRCASFISKSPLLPGIAKQDLRGRELPDSPPFLFDAMLAQAKEMVVEGETVRLAGHKVVLKEDEEQARAAIERAFEKAGLAVPALPEVLAKSGVEAARARSLLQILLREKRLVRISDDLVFHRSAMERLRAMLADAKGRAIQRGHVQGLDRHFAQVRHPPAGVPGPRARHAPRRRRALVL